MPAISPCSPHFPVHPAHHRQPLAGDAGLPCDLRRRCCHRRQQQQQRQSCWSRRGRERGGSCASCSTGRAAAVGRPAGGGSLLRTAGGRRAGRGSVGQAGRAAAEPGSLPGAGGVSGEALRKPGNACFGHWRLRNGCLESGSWGVGCRAGQSPRRRGERSQAAMSVMRQSTAAGRQGACREVCTACACV